MRPHLRGKNLDTVVNICLPSDGEKYKIGGCPEKPGQKQRWYLQNNQSTKGRGEAQVVQGLCGMHSSEFQCQHHKTTTKTFQTAIHSCYFVGLFFFWMNI
jgi:hypothetical protein